MERNNMLNHNELVSVIIPIYNVEKYLHGCVDSVIKQTYSNLEIILVDDGSPDNCPAICNMYAQNDSRIRVIHKENGGLSDARNAGLTIAHGEYVYFLDSDDYIEPEAIETLVNEAVHYDADFVFFDANVINEAGKTKYHNNAYHRMGLYSNPLNGIDMLENLMKYNEYRSAVPLLFIKKKVLSDKKLSFIKGLIYEDDLFTFQLYLESNCVVHLNEALYNRRVRDNSIMSGNIQPKNLRSIIFIINEMLSGYVNEKGKKAEIIKTRLCYMLPCINRDYYGLDRKERRLFSDEIRSLKKNLRKENYLGDPTVKKFCNKKLLMQIKERMYFAAKRVIPNKYKIFIMNTYKKLKMRNENSNAIVKLKNTKDTPRIILIGSPVHGNLGDHAIAIAENLMFKDKLPDREVIEILMPEYINNSRKIKRYINKDDIIFIGGGGWLGTLWQHNEETVREVVKKYPENKIVILPQTVYFEATKEGRVELEKSRRIYSSHKHLLFCLREKSSYNYVLEQGFIQKPGNVLLLPDMALYLQHDFEETQRDGILLCFRADRERASSLVRRRTVKEYLWKKGEKVSYTTTVYLDSISKDKRQDVLTDKLNEYSKAKLVITDRLHSMLFAAITGTPCIAFDNLTGKVKGVYEWIKDLGYLKIAIDEREAIFYIDQILYTNAEKHSVFNNEKIKEEFAVLATKIDQL